MMHRGFLNETRIEEAGALPTLRKTQGAYITGETR